MCGPAARLALLALALGAIAAPAAQATEGLALTREPESLTKAPPGFVLNGRQAIGVARATPKVRVQLAADGRLRPHALLIGADYWLIDFYRGRDRRAEVEVNGRSGRVKYAIRGRELGWPPLARGERGPYARTVHLLMLVSGLLFLLPFVDPRRRLRMLHLDLVALLALGVPFAFAEAGKVYASTPLLYPPLVYLAARLGWLALRGARPDPTPLTWMQPRVLGGALLALLAVRYGLDVGWGRVNDIGYDSLVGADSIIHGYPVYEPGSHLGSYGPAVYLAYVPFSLVFPFTDLSHLHVEAAKAAAIAWDAGAVAALYAIGRRLRPGAAGIQLGLALAFAFAACPWTGFVLSHNTNDGLVAFGLALVALAAASPPARGLILAVVAAAKFAPLVLVPLMAHAGRERGRRAVLVYGGTLAATFTLLVLAYLPDGGLRAFWDATLGYELGRTAPFSVWGLVPELEPLRVAFTAAGGALAIGAFFLPRERTLPRLAAAGAALLIVAQMTAIYWYFFYLVWFIPYALIALLALREPAAARSGPG